MNSLTSVCGYGQLINKPTHVTKESSSCIDLIFATSPIVIRETGVELLIFFFCSGMLINTVPDDCLMYIGFNLL